MATIKIISNPYQKEIRYQKLDEEHSSWIDIDFFNHKGSQLLSKGLQEGFFPFRAKQIIDVIVEEFGITGEEMNIQFEGSADEFLELEAACREGEYDVKVVPSKTGISLENARDILPKVRELFKEMSPLIHQSVGQEKIQRDLGRFSDASGDVVPICVLGNYSAGKSTFINALIGNEILPSGAEPVTAKVYKISKSEFSDRAEIKCQYLGRDMLLSFLERETHLKEGIVGNPLATELNQELSEIENEPLVVKVNKALSIINAFENNTPETVISDVIEVEIPFVNGVLANSNHPFVIFDTPGSNSASNAKHLQVLKQAMANMTNGLPIFLCTPDSLDSMDNENLYHIIHDMEELDDRFTMIVVNKADNAGMGRKGSTAIEQERILSQAVPKNLYSGGLFYVSSILGLGAKTDGEFVDYDYEDIYDAQVVRYQDPSHKHYRTLYQYDIMPAQIKHRADTLAMGQSNLVYANSGLFTIEAEIDAFAGKYAAYNKCLQSQMFLRNAIRTTEEEIKNDKLMTEGIRQSIRDKLESDKEQLINKLEETAAVKRDGFDMGYADYMMEFLASAEGIFSSENLREQEEKFTKAQEAEMGYESRQEDVKKSWSSMAVNLKSSVNSASKKFSIASVRNIVEGVQADIGATVSTYKAQFETKHQVDRAVADKLLQYVSTLYDNRLSEMHELLTSQSQKYWSQNTEMLRDELARIVAGSEVLTADRRHELERIIITYQQLSFENSSAESIFNKGEFEWRIKIGDHVLWQFDHLNIEKLVKTYNTSMSENVNVRYQSIEDSHRESAHNWIQSLLDEIYTNIVDYSPELSKQAKQIRTMTKNIEDLTARQAKLRAYTAQLCTMMDWKETK